MKEELMYQAALETAERKLAVGPVESRLLSPRLGTGGNFTDIFLWDTVFCAFWGKFHPDRFPVEKSLDNFYRCQEPDGFISRQIRPNGKSKWSKEHPVSFAPPLLSWIELELDRDGLFPGRLKQVYPHLKRLREFNIRHYRRTDGLYFSDCFGCGMDDLPRWDTPDELATPGGIPLVRENILVSGEEGDRTYRWMCGDKRFHFDWNRQLGWCDTSCQMAFDALNLAEIAARLGLPEEEARFRREHAEAVDGINGLLYDEKRHFYFDRLGGRLLSHRHIGAFWSLIAGCAAGERADRMVETLMAPEYFNRPCGLPGLSADDPQYGFFGTALLARADVGKYALYGLMRTTALRPGTGSAGACRKMLPDGIKTLGKIRHILGKLSSGTAGNAVAVRGEGFLRLDGVGADYDLSGIFAGKLRMKVAVITDLHFASKPNLRLPTRRGEAADRLLCRALEEVTARGADVLIVPGDLVDEPTDTASLARLAEILAQVHIPQIVIPGNHDPAEEIFYRVIPRPPEYLDFGHFRLTPYCDEQTAGYNARRSQADLRRQHEMRCGFSGTVISIQHVPLFEPGLADCYRYDNAAEIFARHDFDDAISGQFLSKVFTL